MGPAGEVASHAPNYDDFAPSYDDWLDSPGDRWTRQAFRALVDRHVTPKATILDFGAGTGHDAEYFSGTGHAVIAFDTSAAMSERVAQRCAAAVADGRVRTWLASYDDFRRDASTVKADAVVANFAVLNHINAPADTFEAFARCLSPRGAVVVSVLNPYFWKEARSLGWWRSRLRARGKSSMLIGEASPPAYWHKVGALQRAARPHFQLIDRASVAWLVRRSGEHSPWSAPRTLAEKLETAAWRRWPFRGIGQFQFLVFRSVR